MNATLAFLGEFYGFKFFGTQFDNSNIALLAVKSHVKVADTYAHKVGDMYKVSNARLTIVKTSDGDFPEWSNAIYQAQKTKLQPKLEAIARAKNAARGHGLTIEQWKERQEAEAFEALKRGVRAERAKELVAKVKSLDFQDNIKRILTEKVEKMKTIMVNQWHKPEQLEFISKNKNLLDEDWQNAANIYLSSFGYVEVQVKRFWNK